MDYKLSKLDDRLQEAMNVAANDISIRQIETFSKSTQCGSPKAQENLIENYEHCGLVGNNHASLCLNASSRSYICQTANEPNEAHVEKTF